MPAKKRTLPASSSSELEATQQHPAAKRRSTRHQEQQQQQQQTKAKGGDRAEQLRNGDNSKQELIEKVKPAKSKSTRSRKPNSEGAAAPTGEAAIATSKGTKGRSTKAKPLDRVSRSSNVEDNTKSLPEDSDVVPTVRLETVSEQSPAASSSSRYWLLKAEPNTRIEKGKDVKFSIDDLAAMKGPAGWDGVRNYVARNHMRGKLAHESDRSVSMEISIDLVSVYVDMKKGDLAFFYHSNCKEPGIVGIMEIVEEAIIDETAFDPKEPYYDPKSVRDKSKWVLVRVEFRRKLSRLIGLAELKSHGSGKLKEMALLKLSRLSVSPVNKEEWDFILSLEVKDGENR